MVELRLNVDSLTRKEFHLWCHVCLGMSLVDYAKIYKLNHRYVIKKFQIVKKKLKLSGRTWRKFVIIN